MKSQRLLTTLSDPAKFEDLFKRYYAALCSFAYQYTTDHDVAEEIVQDTFTYLWENSNRIQIRTTLESYLYGAIRNAALNHLKRQKVHEKYELHTKTQEITRSENFIELDELEEAIDKALAALPEKCREIFEMSRYRGMTYVEISNALNISIKTVETQMSRALKSLRQALKHYM